MPTKRQTPQRRTTEATARQDAQRQDAQRQDAQRQDGQRQDAQRQAPERLGERRQDARRQDARRQDIPPRAIRRESSYLLTQQQIRCMEQLPEGHKLVSTRSGAPIVRRPDGRLLRVQPNGRFVTTISVERVQSYLRLNESMP
jgi:hypothetical protein